MIAEAIEVAEASAVEESLAPAEAKAPAPKKSPKQVRKSASKPSSKVSTADSAEVSAAKPSSIGIQGNIIGFEATSQDLQDRGGKREGILDSSHCEAQGQICAEAQVSFAIGGR